MPEPILEFENPSLLAAVSLFQKIISAVRFRREKRLINLKQPISSLKLMIKNQEIKDNL